MTPDNRPKTTNHSVTFPLVWLKAIRNFSAKNDKRHCLNGVAISNGALVATNRHCLGAMIHAGFDVVPQVIIPNDAVDTFIRSATKEAKWTKYVYPNVTVCWEYTDDFSTAKPGTLTLEIQESRLFTLPFMGERGSFLNTGTVSALTTRRLTDTRNSI